jgi:hypothetical protein
MMTEDGFLVSPEALKGMASSMDGHAPALSADARAVSTGLTVHTGNPALDALIARLAGQVAASLGGCGGSLHWDAVDLGDAARMYVAADLHNRPSAGGGQ